MSHEQIIAQVGRLLAELPVAQAAEVLDFALFLQLRQQAQAAAEATQLTQQIQQHILAAEAFAFLQDEAEDVYTLADAKFQYHAPPAADATE